VTSAKLAVEYAQQKDLRDQKKREARSDLKGGPLKEGGGDGKFLHPIVICQQTDIDGTARDNRARERAQKKRGGGRLTEEGLVSKERARLNPATGPPGKSGNSPHKAVSVLAWGIKRQGASEKKGSEGRKKGSRRV